MNAFDPKVNNDYKIKATFEMLKQGKTKEEIADHFGNNSWSSVAQYFRRKGYRWNGATFVPNEGENISAYDEARFVNSKAGQIVRQLSQKSTNIRQVGLKNGFSTVEAMGDYMKGQGYVWNNEIENYDYDESLSTKLRNEQSATTPAPSSEGIEGYQQLLSYLLLKQEKLFALLEIESAGTLPRYKFRGGKVNKTLGFPASVVTLLNDFSKEYNVTQRDILEVALAEFFSKYGYKEQLNSVLQA
ncbi:hypothetical protein ACFVHQ_13420 [Actinomycetes bacterium NPDC127524]